MSLIPLLSYNPFPHSYTEFRQLLVTEAQKYPCPVQEVLNTYDTSICKYFGVGRTPSKVCNVQKQYAETVMLQS